MSDDRRTPDPLAVLIEGWLTDGHTDQDTPLDDYGREVLRDVLTALREAKDAAG